MTKTVLVTGSSGFIAYHTISQLLSKGYSVVGVDDHNSSTSVLLKETRLSFLNKLPNYEFFLGSIVDKETMEPLFAKYKFSGVINFAARAGVRASVLDPEIYIKTNELGLINLLNCCKNFGVSKFIQASTSSVYDGEKMPFLESSASNRPISPYAASKKGAEGHAYAYHYLHHLDVSILRFFTVYGPFGRPDMSVFRFIKWIYEGKPLKVNGTGLQTRDFTYVEDIARAVILAFEQSKGFEIYNAGNNQAYSLLQMIAFLEVILEKKANIEFFQNDPSDTEHTHANIDKIKNSLGWEPLVPLPKGLEKTVEWFLKNYDWVKHVEI